MEPNSPIMQFVPFIAVLVIFYFLLIRPQQKQMKERKLMLDGLKASDRILTQGGMIGVITAVKGEELEVEIAKGVKVALVKTGVASVLKSA
ncbi:MAG: preprotein translocase [Elusimicrobia bacterium]|nr:MAG: preprotein translocase [Elusimicrobiota bacterium]KAF0156612.1 MAG: preprotein translocase [Elusimicrobiota bacterium]